MENFMDYDVAYLIMMLAGTINLGFTAFSKYSVRKRLCLTLAGLAFMQAGICAYNGLYSDLHDNKKFQFFAVAEARASTK